MNCSSDMPFPTGLRQEYSTQLQLSQGNCIRMQYSDVAMGCGSLCESWSFSPGYSSARCEIAAFVATGGSGQNQDQAVRPIHSTRGRSRDSVRGTRKVRQTMPPLTPIICPVTHRASSETRNAITSAMSRVRPSRPRGVMLGAVSRESCETIAVSVGPGAMAFTVTLRGPSSLARILTNCSTAALLAAYNATPGRPCKVMLLEMPT